MSDEKQQLAGQPGALSIPQSIASMVVAARPEGRDEGTLGTEHIGKDDILVPRLALCQPTSPEMNRSHARYIDGLKLADLFNSVTRQNYGVGPLYFSIFRADRPRGVEFRPLEAGGGIVDPNVPLDDPRMQFGEVDPATGKARKPQATKFYDFMCLLLSGLDMADPLQNVVSLSLKGTGLKAARMLNMLITQRGPKAIYKGVYSVTTAVDSGDGKTWAIYKVKNAGWLQPGSPVEQLLAEQHEAWRDLKVKVDLETAAHEGDATFDPEALERESQAARAGAAPTDM